MDIPFAERRQIVKTVAGQNYEVKSDRAKVYLSALYGASLSEQYELFQLVLTEHVNEPDNKPPDNARSESSMPDEIWVPTTFRLQFEVGSWVDKIDKENQTVEQTAHKLWDRLLQKPAYPDRVVCLALFLVSDLVPYTQLPSEIFVEDMLEGLSEKMMEGPAAGLFRRILASHLTPLQKAKGLVYLLSSLSTQAEQIVVMDTVLQWVAQEFASSFQQGQARIPLFSCPT